MFIGSSRQVAELWVAAFVIFFASSWGSTALLPAPGTTTGPTASYYVGLLGLLAIGAALLYTWMWVGRTAPGSPATRVALKGLLTTGTLLWMAAMVFPFL